jgi:DNA primase catalytic core
MARIPEEQLRQLKASVRLRQLIEAKGVELRRLGADLVGRCPFHEGDNEPSLHLTEGEPDLWHCFGCGAGGDAISWIQKAEGVSFRHAVEILGRLAGAAAAELPPRRLKRVTVLDRSADDQALLRQVVDFYHQNLKNKPEALAYLEKRGLCHPELITRFSLGYADKTLGYQLPKGTHTALRQRLKALGVLRAETGHEHYAGCLVIPIFDEHGAVAGLYGRRITAAQRGAPEHLYLPGPHRGVWNAEALSASRELIVCEALLDALSFWVHGYRNVLSAFGVSGFTEEMREALRRHGTERVLIAYDRDEAGDRAAEALSEQLGAEGIGCFRVEFPWGLDANDYVRQQGRGAAEALGRRIRAARWMGQGAAPALQTVAEPLRLTVRAEATQGSSELAAQSVAQQLEPQPAEPEASNPSEAKGLERNASAANAGPEPALSLAAGAAAARAEAPAAPGPAAGPGLSSLALQARGDALEARFGDRLYRVRGLGKNQSLEQLRVTLFSGRAEAFHVDTLDLYNARQRGVYTKLAAEELGVEPEVVKRDLGKLLLALEELHEQKMREALAPKSTAPEMSEPQREAALELLRDPRLVERIVVDFERCGLVGEETNKLLCYLAAVSRLLERPLGVLVQSSSAAGKSSLMDAVLALMPPEQTVRYSAMTGQALYYMGEQSLSHKILCIAEEQGAERAAYALKLLLSEGCLSIAAPGKDPASGKLVTHQYGTDGPTMVFSGTTAAEIEEELQNRCLVVAVDEGRAQTRAIHQQQRRRHGPAGLWAREEREQVVRLHQNAQRLLRPLHVLNPWADELTFLDDRTRTRRDHAKYLTLIEAIALLHQYQRPLRSSSFQGQEKSYIEVAAEDLELANRLASEAFGRSLDELPPQSRALLLFLDRWVSERCAALSLERSEYRFRARELREASGWGNTQLKVHLGRLVELEYLLVHRAARGQSYVYELLYEGGGKDGERFLMKLIDPRRLAEAGASPSGPYDGKWSAPQAQRSGPAEERPASGRALAGPQSAPGRPGSEPAAIGFEHPFSVESAQNALEGPQHQGRSAALKGRRNGRAKAERP